MLPYLRSLRSRLGNAVLASSLALSCSDLPTWSLRAQLIPVHGPTRLAAHSGGSGGAGGGGGGGGPGWRGSR
jgi:hypothetical protein